MASNRQKAGVAIAETPPKAIVPVDPIEAAVGAIRPVVDGYVALVALTPITSAAEYDVAANLLGDIRAAEVAHEAERTAITQPMNIALRRVNGLFKPLAEELGKAKEALSGKMLTFRRTEEAKRQAAERAAEEERKRAQAEADAKLADAVAAAAAGEEGADARLEAAAMEASMAEIGMTMPAVAAPPAKGGHATRKRYLGAVTDQPAFLRHMASLIEKGDATLDGVVEYNLGKLNTLGTNTNGALRIPGVTFTADEKIVARKSN